MKCRKLRWSQNHKAGGSSRGHLARLPVSIQNSIQGRKWFTLCYLFIDIFWPHHTACGILVHWPGIEPVPPVEEAWRLNHWTTRKFSVYHFFLKLNPLFEIALFCFFLFFNECFISEGILKKWFGGWIIETLGLKWGKHPLGLLFKRNSPGNWNAAVSNMEETNFLIEILA